MSIESQLEKEEQYIEEAYAAGDISYEEYKKEMRELHREYRAAAEESAQQAYYDELNRW